MLLKTVELIDKLGEEYADMLKQVNIPDFYKCIAQYSGISIKYLQSDVIEDYLTQWAINKKPIFDFFGGKTRVDLEFSYKEENKDYYDIYIELAKKYPAYYFWLYGIRGSNENKMLEKVMGYDQCCAIKKCFPDYKWNEETITHFFKNKLNAPDTLITEIGRIYENNEIQAKFTLSIDPVDIMLSSETPYDWQSCYRLEEFCDSHSDGCLAGVIDHPTIVTYIWTEEGKYNLYEKYEFKKIRYKRMRMTIAINKEFNAIHFNTIYPGKNNLSEGFQQKVRDIVETYFAKQLNKQNIWKKNRSRDEFEEKQEIIRCHRYHPEYGYSEYDDFNVYYLVGEEHYSDIYSYDEVIYCPCGCGEPFIGSDYCDDWMCYNGCGHVNENYDDYYEEEGIWCDTQDCLEYDCDGDCLHCRIFNESNATCELTEEACELYEPFLAQQKGMIDLSESSTIHCDIENCKNCPHFKEHHFAAAAEGQYIIDENGNTEIAHIE